MIEVRLELGVGADTPHATGHFERIYTGIRLHSPCLAHRTHGTSSASCWYSSSDDFLRRSVVWSKICCVEVSLSTVVGVLSGSPVVSRAALEFVSATTFEARDAVYPAAEEIIQTKAKTYTRRAWLLTICE